MSLIRMADGFSSADTQGMSLDPQASEPGNEYQTPRDLASSPDTDGQDPASPGGPAPYNGAEPAGAPVTSNPELKAPDEPKKQPYADMPYVGPGPAVDTTTLHNARRQPMEENMTVDLWTLASRDAEAEQQHERMVRAKVAVATFWPFLSAAMSEHEFGHRLALVEDRVEELFPEPGFRDQVVASLHEDYRSTKLAAVGPTPPEGGGEHPGNPDYFAVGPEAGPNTGSDGQFAQFPAGPDPYNPMNEQYPMQPGQWTVPPDKAWVDRPMQFGATLTARTAVDYQGEGVQTGPIGSSNPAFFDQGSDGLQGDGFAPDVSPPEPDERVDMVGSQPPAGSQPAQNRTAGRYVLAEKDNHGACAHCNSPVYREGDTWKHLGGNPGHGVRLPDEHPWVANAQASRVMAARKPLAKGEWVKTLADHHDPDQHFDLPAGHVGRIDHVTGPEDDELGRDFAAVRVEHPKAELGYTYIEPGNLRRTQAPTPPKPKKKPYNPFQANYQYVKPNPDGDGYVVTQKGTGKVLSHHDTQEDAEASFRAMEMHKHEGARHVARWVFADASSSDMGSGANSGSTPAQVDPTAAPPAPGSMEGGPGSTAGAPLTIPNDSVGTNPMAGQTPPTQPQAQPQAPMNAMASRHQADVRERPTFENPSGVGDEYQEKTWDAAAQQRPLQAGGDRNVNTPQRPGRPIPTVETQSQGEKPDDDEEDD